VLGLAVFGDLEVFLCVLVFLRNLSISIENERVGLIKLALACAALLHGDISSWIKVNILIVVCSGEVKRILTTLIAPVSFEDSLMIGRLFELII
jgi:hypothetical protein